VNYNFHYQFPNPFLKEEDQSKLEQIDDLYLTLQAYIRILCGLDKPDNTLERLRVKLVRRRIQRKL
jgi:hypothetical protein